MTRAEMAESCKHAAEVCEIEGMPAVWPEGCRAAAAELAKDCAGCKWFIGARGEVMWASCAARGGMHSIPADGSGFCHRWAARAAP